MKNKRLSFDSLLAGWQDSNLRLPESKSGALPLGYIPITPTQDIIHIIQEFVNGKM